MKPVSEMTIGELAAFVCSHLKKNGIDVVLSGGACVSIYTTNKHESYDLDFIENITTSRKRLKEVLQEIGFFEDHRYFKNPDTEFFLEFPLGPLSIGAEPVKEIIEKEFPEGTLKLISPTDCIKDRLVAFYHWNDRQCLEQAILVSQEYEIDLDDIERWSTKEGKSVEFANIRSRLIKT